MRALLLLGLAASLILHDSVAAFVSGSRRGFNSLGFGNFFAGSDRSGRSLLRGSDAERRNSGALAFAWLSVGNTNTGLVMRRTGIGIWPGSEEPCDGGRSPHLRNF